MVLIGVKTVVAVILFICVAKASANPCAGRNSGLVNDYSGCRNLFECWKTIAYPLNCALGYYFDEAKQKCDLKENVVCTRCPPTGVIFARSPNSCSAYTICINGTPLDQECAPGLWFDIHTSSCALIDDVTCEGINNCPPTGVAVVPDVADCRQYRLCSDGDIVKIRPCTTGLWFDWITLQCVVGNYCPNSTFRIDN